MRKSVQHEHLVYEQEGRLLHKALAKCDRRRLCSWPKQNNIILIFIVDGCTSLSFVISTVGFLVTRLMIYRYAIYR